MCAESALTKRFDRVLTRMYSGLSRQAGCLCARCASAGRVAADETRACRQRESRPEWKKQLADYKHLNTLLRRLAKVAVTGQVAPPPPPPSPPTIIPRPQLSHPLYMRRPLIRTPPRPNAPTPHFAVYSASPSAVPRRPQYPACPLYALARLLWGWGVGGGRRSRP